MSFLTCSTFLLKNWRNVSDRSLMGMLLGRKVFLVLPSGWLVTLYSCLEEGICISHHCSIAPLLCASFLDGIGEFFIHCQAWRPPLALSLPEFPFWPSWHCMTCADRRLVTFLLVSGPCWSRTRRRLCTVPVCKLSVRAVSQLSVEKVLDVNLHLAWIEFSRVSGTYNSAVGQWIVQRS